MKVNIRISKGRKNLRYKLVKFQAEGVGRCLFVNSRTLVPSLAASLFEAAYARGERKNKGSIFTLFHHVAFLFTWASEGKVDLEFYLLSGFGLRYKQIKSFSDWLSEVVDKDSNTISSYNRQVMQSCKTFVVWFVFNYVSSSELIKADVELIALVNTQRFFWSKATIGGEGGKLALDLSDSEINSIENLLLHEFEEAKFDKGICHRNYLLWRLVKAFGLRIGEALSLRLEDLNLSGSDPYVEIVHLDRRNSNLDSRVPYNPKVKTLGRYLYIQPEDDDLVGLLELYVKKYRVMKKFIRGKMRVTNFLDHDYLFVAHGSFGAGKPLSCSAASRIANVIQRKSGVTFRWHLLRHSKFNRLYIAAQESPDRNAAIDSIVYMGGWRSETSLLLYANRAVRDSTRRKVTENNKRRVQNGSQ